MRPTTSLNTSVVSRRCSYSSNEARRGTRKSWGQVRNDGKRIKFSMNRHDAHLDSVVGPLHGKPGANMFLKDPSSVSCTDGPFQQGKKAITCKRILNPCPISQRHNIGFMAVDALVQRRGASQYKPKWEGLCAEYVHDTNGFKVHALKPQTFMNLSGRRPSHTLKTCTVDPGWAINDTCPQRNDTQHRVPSTLNPQFQTLNPAPKTRQVAGRCSGGPRDPTLAKHDCDRRYQSAVWTDPDP